MTARLPGALLCLLGLAFARPAGATVETGTVRLGGPEESHRWGYLGKFGYHIGVGSYDLRLRLKKPLPEGAQPVKVDLDVFLDEDWDRVEQTVPCRRSLEARQTHRMLDVSRQGYWSPWVGGELAQSMRPHFWYFALSGCSSNGQTISIDPRDIEFELVMRQAGGSHFSVELLWMPAATIVALLSLTTFLACFVMGCRHFRRSAGSVHPVIRTLAAAIVLQWLAQVLHLVHLRKFHLNGEGRPTAEAIAEVLFMSSQVIVSTLLIAIASGYTLRTSAANSLGTIRVVAAAVAMLHVILVGHSQLQPAASHKYHENEGAAGWALLILRMALYGWFVQGIKSLSQKSGFRLQIFLQRFKLAGSVYFLAYPAIFLLTQVFAPYLRHPIMQIGLALMQTVSAVWLSDLFLSRGAYFEVSSLSSCLLPGCSGGHAGFVKDD